ncbi:hypothetical protein MKL29_09270 [Streptococcus suis]|nr:hypothetical protein [Streptococcus suis]
MDNYWEKIRLIHSQVIIGIIYFIITVIYLFKLNQLNHILNSNFSSDQYIEIVTFDSNKPLYYAIVALILSLIAIGLIVALLKKITQGIDEYTLVTILGMAFILLLLLILIIVLINNPILRAVIIVCGMAGAIGYGMSS